MRYLVFSLLIIVSACSPALRVIEPSSTPDLAGSATPVRLPPDPSPTPEPSPTYVLEPTPTITEFDQLEALLPEFADEMDSLEDATRYLIEVRVEMDSTHKEASVTGWVHIDFTNTTGEVLDELALMLWPNNRDYEGSMSAGPVYMDDTVLVPGADENGIALKVQLPEPLDPEDELDFAVPFHIEAKAFPMGEPRRFGLTEGVLIAPTFYPLIPLYEDGEWEMADAPPGGDTTNSEIAFYQVEVTFPHDLDLVASGIEVAREEGDVEDVATFVSGPMRDFALAIGPFEQVTTQVGDTSIHFWLLEEHQDDLPVLEKAAADQMELLVRQVGPYPYPELDIVDAPGAYGGIEYPGLLYIGTLGSTWIVEPTVHEIAHQWFYGLVGNDQISEPWLDEALATYAEALYYENSFDSGRSVGFLSNLRNFLRITEAPDLPIGLGVADYPTESRYAEIVYFKGALFLDALRGAMGDRKFFEFLQSYFETYRYGMATADGFQRIAENTCDCELDELFDLWVVEGGPVPGLSE